MSRIEVIFGGILVLAVIAAGSFVLFQNGFAFPVAVSASQSTSMSVTAREGAAFTGERQADICTCYETGFANGTGGGGLESTEYKAGYTACRMELGPQGGDAWSSGWRNGAENRLAQRNCRLYMKTVSAE